MAPRVRVDVWSDLVCPWCYIGLARLRRVAREDGLDLELVHHAYQLDPTPAASGPTRAYLAERYGAANVDSLFQHAEQAAAGEGLRLDLASSVAANTFDGHRLVAAAAEHGLQDAVVQRLMRGHFEERVDLGDRATLARLAAEAGLAPSEVDRVLSGTAGAEHVETDLDSARELGVRGVPLFVVAQRLAYSGAQPEGVMREAFRQAMAAPA